MLDKDLIREIVREELNKPIHLDIIYHDKNMPRLEKIDKGNWIDLRIIVGGKKNGVKLTEEDFKDGILKYKEGDTMMLCLGISLNQPKGYEINIVPRSSTFKNYGILLANSQGIIDNTYSGNNDQWCFPALFVRDAEIKVGDRIAQFRICLSQKATIWQKIKWLFTNKIKFVEVDNLDSEDRGGFGSTGK